MPRPIKRRDLIRRLRLLGWEGLYQKGAHPYMVKGPRRLTVPNPHGDEMDWTLVKRILAQAGVDPSEWDRLP